MARNKSAARHSRLNRTARDGPCLLQPGRNCWRIEPADRVRFLIDGAEYFHVFRNTAKLARRSIYIIGWDIDSRFVLEREPPADGLPVALGDFLESLVRRNRQLHVHILDWDYASLYAPEREWLTWLKLDWAGHRRLHFRMDSNHPAGASHHQKIVVVDDSVAFVGGLDFTLGRWDTPGHLPGDTRRRDLDDTIPQPYHDVQMMVSGKVARALGELARDRWERATGETHRVPERTGGGETCWPDGTVADLTTAQVAIARTVPADNGQEAIREVEQLLVDACLAARRWIYIENQYLTARVVGEVLSLRLTEPDGPEVAIVLPEQTVGWLSQNTMDVLRERLLRRLATADLHDRLRVYSPRIPGLEGECLNVHAKVLIIDDMLARVGSANLNNRSMGLDTECDLALADDGSNGAGAAIAGLRARLLAEHLGATPDAVRDTLARHGSLIRTIEHLAGTGRTLVPLGLNISTQRDARVPQADIADPEEPVDVEDFTRQLVVADDERSPVRMSLLALASLLFTVLLLAATWRWTPLGEWLDPATFGTWLGTLQTAWSAPLIVLAVYLAGGLIAFPVTLLVIATGLAFGAWHGFVYAMLGAELSALLTFFIGQNLGHDTLRSLAHHRVARISRRLARQGLLAIITLRVVPVAPFTFINLVAGASHISLRDFALGTLIGLAPGTLALTVFSGQVTAAIADPAIPRIAVLLVLALLIALGSWWLGRWLLRRQRTGHDTARS